MSSSTNPITKDTRRKDASPDFKKVVSTIIYRAVETSDSGWPVGKESEVTKAIFAVHNQVIETVRQRAYSAPMGVSEWIKHGEKYGYLKYATEAAVQEGRIDELDRLTNYGKLIGEDTVSVYDIQDRLAQLQTPTNQKGDQ